MNYIVVFWCWYIYMLLCTYVYIYKTIFIRFGYSAKEKAPLFLRFFFHPLRTENIENKMAMCYGGN